MIFLSRIVSPVVIFIILIQFILASPPDWVDDSGGYEFMAINSDGIVQDEGVREDDDRSPEAFFFNLSMQYAYYFFETATIGGESLADEDWIGAFRMGYCSNSTAPTEEICGLIGAEWNSEEICVGARKWGDCYGTSCDVPVMGNDGSEYTIGYMTTGVIPYYKIYDASNDEYLDAIVSVDYPWTVNGFFLVESLENAVAGCLDVDACNYDANANIDDGSCVFANENYDCDGNCVEDCTGECGGSSELDACGVCGGDNSSCLDCAGVPNGNADMDDCGVCDGGNADDLGCGCFVAGPSGCDEECGSTLEIDECGVCGGDAELDECGVCEGPGIPDGDCDCNGNVDLGCGCGAAGASGCDNVCGSTLEDDACGVCDGDGIPDGDCDCSGNVDFYFRG